MNFWLLSIAFYWGIVLQFWCYGIAFEKAAQNFLFEGLFFVVFSARVPPRSRVIWLLSRRLQSLELSFWETGFRQLRERRKALRLNFFKRFLCFDRRDVCPTLKKCGQKDRQGCNHPPLCRRA
ncbi:MAG: hypothetical protein LBS36_09880 [Oscillospiraceae bacterium]|nr:hypothetical protein [Oscillospiraceae bacterium]